MAAARAGVARAARAINKAAREAAAGAEAAASAVAMAAARARANNKRGLSCPSPRAHARARALVGSCVWRSAPSLSRPSACLPLARFAFEVKHRPSAPHRAPAVHEKSTNGDATPGWRRPRGDTHEARALVGEQAGYAAAVYVDKLPVRGERRRGGATSAMQVEGMDAFERSKTWRTVVHLTCPRQRALGAAADSAKLGEVGRSARASRATATSARSREGHSGH